MLSTVSLFVLIAGIAASPAYQSMSLGTDGSYQFSYETGKEAGSHSREETRGPDGVVVGKYSYQDPTGDMRVVNYRADDLGYVAKGDVSVPGAPQSQFPVEEPQEKSEPEEGDDGSDDGDTKEKPTPSDDSKDSASTPEPQTDNEDYEDDVKAMKIQEPSYDAPPDGFPVGFFDQSFQGLRRLPEPVADTEEKKTSSENAESTSDSKPETNTDQKAHTAFFNAIFPFTHFEPHSGSDHAPFVPGAHHPVYVYSYQQPQAHGYYYVY